jgi:hypothetical protein
VPARHEECGATSPHLLPGAHFVVRSARPNHGIAIGYGEAAAGQEVSLHVDHYESIAVAKAQLPRKLRCDCGLRRHVVAPTAFARAGSLSLSAA